MDNEKPKRLTSSFEDMIKLYESTNDAYRFLINELIGQMSQSIDMGTDTIDSEVVREIIKKSLAVAGAKDKRLT